MVSTRSRLGRAALAGLVAVAAGAAGSTPATAGPVPATAAPPARSEQQAVRTVTLITGDRIRAFGDGPDRVEFLPGPDRRGMTYLTSRTPDGLSLIPADAVRLVREGRLDPRLFNVTTLLRFGYDDRRPELPLLMTYDGQQARAAATGTATAAGARVTRQLPAVRGMALAVPRARAATTWTGLTTGGGQRRLRDGVGRVWLDGIRRPALDHSVPQVGAPAAWQAGYDGSGVKVAVLDSGIDVNHPDLTGKIAAVANFTEGMEDDRDLVGHGTHVAATIAGGTIGGGYPGVAPGAKLLDGKVCVVDGCADSWILAGMQWAVENGARVVNLSIGGPDAPDTDPVEQAIDDLSAQHGTLFVVAAGNDGEKSTVNSPASADAALAVGAVDDQDALAPFSSRGPRVGDGAVKPDLTAPGVGITAARSADAPIGTPGDSHVSMSGTSMATPHVAGAAAILAQQHPDWSGAQLKAALTSSTAPRADLDPFAQGTGRLDVARAVRQPVRSDSGAVNFGRMLWPHTDDKPTTQVVTYRNSGSVAVSLNLELAITGPDGKPAPAGMFTLAAPSVTVPAGGQVEVPVTVDTRITGADGQYAGYLRATADGVLVNTPVVVEREVESYDLTLVHLDRTGASAADYGTSVFRWDAPDYVQPSGADGKNPVVRLPKAAYVLTSWIVSGEGADAQIAVLAQPRLVLDHDQTVTLDARSAQPVVVTVPDPTARELFLQVDGAAELAYGYLIFGATTFDGYGHVLTGRVGPDTTADGFVTTVGATYAQLDAEGFAHDTYNLRWLVDGRVPTGFRRTVARAELAEVRMDQGQQQPGTTGVVGARSEIPGEYEQSLSRVVPVTLPGTRVDYHNADGGVRWVKDLEEVVVPPDGGWPEFVAALTSPLTRYVAGRTYSERWNRGVFGPAFPTPPRDPRLWITRSGDTLEVEPPLYGDVGGREGGATSTQTYTLYRDGVKFATSEPPFPSFTLPPEPATYRLEVTADRPAAARLSTRTRVAWTFRSARPSGDRPVPMAVAAVRFTPALDASSAAPAGRPTVVPVTVQRQAGSVASPTRQLAVEVSFDDGVNWRASPLRSTAAGTETVVTPPGPGFVSLRARWSDTAGNALEQTIIRAYEVR
ncbi:S8 family serine peptidase [Micromonospora sp. NPDC049559]|uniref:S8 family serine peptidase n=1 Tax=Micromonospora sp. NPDC049559 TaxID=3155923 RepID=UPI0034263F0C